MPIPSDYRELLKTLNRHRVRYLVVGAYAVIYYTEPRYTKDLDIWIEPKRENAQKVYKALKEFGAPLKGIRVDDFTNRKLVYQIGVEPVRVDIIMGIPNLKFDLAWKQRTIAIFEGVKINILGIKELIKSKKTTKRKTDLSDVESLNYVYKKIKKG
ncbi:MAG: nucleotidyltransferase [Candidatus Omnitrophica bacterium]|nr:nucleotidyltransferase [Candidatus Omnitrophota bacterium]MCM8792995.1 nucleotidyltransferase [Candidatus Omnitrophota bacterium]